MFLNEPERSPADISWVMFGIHVRVHPWFWVMTVLIGWPLVRLGFGYLLAWVGCVFVSILMHELGHVWMGQAFGSRGHIILYSFGGLAVGSSNVPRPWQRIAVYLAGPGIQLLLLLPVYAAWHALTPSREMMPVFVTLGMLWSINLFWPILNLMPIWPLDGGQTTREVLVALWPRNNSGLRTSLVVTLVVAGALAVEAFMAMNHQHLLPPWIMTYVPIGDSLMNVLFFGMFALQSFQLLQRTSGGDDAPSGRSDENLPWEDQGRKPWEQDPDHWKKQ